MSDSGVVIESVLKERRKFPPPADFASEAHVKSMEQYREMCAEAEKDPEAFWAKIAEEHVSWFQKWDKVLDWDVPFAKWFVGGKLNVSYNCVDRHLDTWRKNKAALIWEGEPGDRRTITYFELHREVCKAANVLKSLGVCKGDRVGLYMPLVPELAIAMLACTRIGATHSIVFGGFSADAIRDRMNDCTARVVITADGGYRRGNTFPLKPTVDKALEDCPSVEKVLVVRRSGDDVDWKDGRDVWWHDEMERADVVCEPEALDSEHPLFILYTSGTTGKPKGVLHTTGGYLTHVAYSSKLVFDLKDTDTYWCTADIGWVTGHSYLVYGPLANGATAVMYEGVPNYPEPDRLWEIVERYGVTTLYTAPTLIRTCVKWGEQWPERHDLSSLRLLGTVGEPINPEAWMWYHEKIGGGRCPIVDTWWQTETGGILISPLPGATPTKPGSGTLPLPGIFPEVVDREGNKVGPNEGGLLVVRKPWPSMLRTIYGDDDRYVKTYWSDLPGNYFTGDGARCDEDGYFWIMGRIDDVVNVSGHRLGTMEVESALVAHRAVAEAAVVDRPDDVKGQALAAFVTLEGGYTASDDLKKELREHVGKEIGAFAKPDDLKFTDTLPKTRSGKIMRRLLRDIAAGRDTGDTTTLEDASIVEKLRQSDD
ncbi:MAG: acetate--CoA ligase [Candidatus Binatia bacterium]|nr:acetate--CoA ligase [Candidatus Binatia bacterium]